VSIHDRLREWVRVDNERASPSEVIVDSQSVKPLRSLKQSAMTQPNRLRGKRHLTVDTLGLVLRVFVSAANVGERKGAKRVLKRVKRMGKALTSPHRLGRWGL